MCYGTFIVLFIRPPERSLQLPLDVHSLPCGRFLPGGRDDWPVCAMKFREGQVLRRKEMEGEARGEEVSGGVARGAHVLEVRSGKGERILM